MDKLEKDAIRRILIKCSSEASTANPKLRYWLGNTSTVLVVDEIEKELDKLRTKRGGESHDS